MTERMKLNAVISSQESVIKSLQQQLATERDRVVGLTSLAEPVSILLTLVDDMRNATAVVIRNTLLEEQNPCFEFHPDIFTGLSEDNASNALDSDMAFSTESNPTTAENKYIMYKWLYEKSGEASMRIDPLTGQTLDVYLPIQPENEPVKGQNYDLTDAKILIRAVVSLICDLSDSTSGDSIGASSTSPAISMELLKEINNVKKSSPLSMMRIAVRLAHEVLRTPVFKANDLSRGDGSITLTFVSFLMLTAAPVRPQYTNAKLSRFLGEYEKLQSHVGPIRFKNEGIISKLFSIQNSYANATNQTVVTNILPASTKEFQRSSKMLLTPRERLAESQKEEAQRLSQKQADVEVTSAAVENSVSDADGASQSGEEVVGEVIEPEAPPPPPSPEELYARLATDIDDFLGKYYKIQSYDDSLVGSVQETGRDLVQMMVLRSRAMDWRRARSEGMLVATNAHRSVSSFMLESLAGRLEYIKNELDEKFDTRKKAQTPTASASVTMTMTASATIDNH